MNGFLIALCVVLAGFFVGSNVYLGIVMLLVIVCTIIALAIACGGSEEGLGTLFELMIAGMLILFALSVSTGYYASTQQTMVTDFIHQYIIR